MASTLPTLELVAAGTADLGELLPRVRAYHAFEGIELDDGARRAALLRLLGEPSLGGVWLIRAEGMNVGYVAVCRGFSLEFGGHDGFLDELYLDAPWRGRGIGRAVLAELPPLARALGIRALHLEVARDNAPARRLYAALGFIPRDQYLLMSLPLGQS